MYKPAPCCNAALSVRSIWADFMCAPSFAAASKGSSNRLSAIALTWERNLVMHGHPLRYWFEGAHTAPDRHADEESEIERGQPARQPGLRGAARLHAQV